MVGALKKYSSGTYIRQTDAVDDFISSANKMVMNSSKHIQREIDDKMRILTINQVSKQNYENQRKRYLAIKLMSNKKKMGS